MKLLPHQIWVHWRRQWQPTPVLLPGKSHGQRSLVGCSPWGCEESGTTERLHFHISLSCIGEGNGNPLQCSCLENPRDGGAWWAAVYGVAQSQTRLKWLSSSSSISYLPPQHRDHSRMAPFRTLSHSSSAQIFWSSQLIVFTVFTVFQTQPGTRRQGGGDRRNVEFFPTLFNVSFLSSVPHSCTLISHL